MVLIDVILVGLVCNNRKDCHYSEVLRGKVWEGGIADNDSLRYRCF